MVDKISLPLYVLSSKELKSIYETLLCLRHRHGPAAVEAEYVEAEKQAMKDVSEELKARGFGLIWSFVELEQKD